MTISIFTTHICMMVTYRDMNVAGVSVFFFQAEDGIRYLVRSRGLGDVYKRQDLGTRSSRCRLSNSSNFTRCSGVSSAQMPSRTCFCLLYTSDAADERSSVDLGGRRIIKKKTMYGRVRRRSNREYET